MNFHENLRYYRTQAGYTAKTFANMLKIPYTTYTAYENQGREPKYEILIKIANLLNVSLDNLLNRNTNKELHKNLCRLLYNDMDRTAFIYEDNPFKWINIGFSISSNSVDFYMITDDYEQLWISIDRTDLETTIKDIQSEHIFSQPEIFQRYILYLFTSVFLIKRTSKKFLSFVGILAFKKEKLNNTDKEKYIQFTNKQQSNLGLRYLR